MVTLVIYSNLNFYLPISVGQLLINLCIFHFSLAEWQWVTWPGLNSHCFLQLHSSSVESPHYVCFFQDDHSVSVIPLNWIFLLSNVFLLDDKWNGFVCHRYTASTFFQNSSLAAQVETCSVPRTWFARCSRPNYKKIMGDIFMDFLKNENTVRGSVWRQRLFSIFEWIMFNHK